MLQLPPMPRPHKRNMLKTYDGPRCELPPEYLEITRYSGTPSQLAFSLYLIDNARSLKKVTVVATDEEALARARRDFRHITSASILVTM